MVRPWPRALGVSLTATLAVWLTAAAPTSQTPAAPTITEQFLKRPVERLNTYRAWRRLDGESTRADKAAWMEVMTEVHPDGRFEWKSLGHGGSDYVLERVLIPVITTESETTPKSRAAAELNTDNYTFKDAPADAEGRPRIRLVPKRKEKFLLDGWLIVSPDDADLLEIHGRLAKGPSMWTPNVMLKRYYKRILGVRVPVFVTSEAEVRLAGRFRFTMTYRYELIEGRIVTTDAK